MSEDILDDFLKKLRETGETSFVPGPLDRGLSSQNPDLSLNLNVERVADRAKQGFTDARGRAREIGGKVYLNPDRTAYVPYYKDATDALLNPTAMNVAGSNAPYYGAVAATALVGGGLVAAGAEGAAAIGGLGALGTSAAHIGGFLTGSAVAGYGATQGLGAMGFNGPTPYEQLTQAGPLAATATGVGLATFRPGLPGSMELFKKQAIGGAMFAGGVGIEEAGRAAIGKANGTDERPASKIIADAALHTGEAFLFGVAMKPTAVGGALIQGGRNMANAGNVIPSMIASSQFGGGLFRRGPSPLDIKSEIIPAREPSMVINEDGTQDYDVGSPARRVGGQPYVQQNTRGRGGVIIQNGVPVAGEMVPTTPAEPGQTGLSTQTQNSTLRPSKTGRGDATSFDPATGAGLKIEVLPNGDVNYTLFTNLGGAALKARGPYRDLPDQFRVGHHDMVRANFDARVAANEAARQEAVNRAKAAAERTQADIPPVPAATAEAPPPVPSAPAAAPTAPVVPKAAPVTPPVSAAMAAVQARHDAAQEAERAAGQAATKASQDYAEAALREAQDRTPATTEARRAASQAEAGALIILEKAQMEAEAASKGLAAAKQAEAANNASSSTPAAQGEKVNPRPLWSTDNGLSAREWDSKYSDTHNPETGVKYSEEARQQLKLRNQAREQLFKEEREWEKTDPGVASDSSNDDSSLFLGKKRVIPRAMLTTPAGRIAWDELYGSRYNVNGDPKAVRSKGPLPAPAEPSAVPPKPVEPVTILSAEEAAAAGKKGQNLPSPIGDENVRIFDNEMKSPLLGGTLDKDGKAITISELSMADAQGLLDSTARKMAAHMEDGSPGYLRGGYALYLAGVKKLAKHIKALDDKQKSDELEAEVAAANADAEKEKLEREEFARQQAKKNNPLPAENEGLLPGEVGNFVKFMRAVELNDAKKLIGMGDDGKRKNYTWKQEGDNRWTNNDNTAIIVKAEGGGYIIYHRPTPKAAAPVTTEVAPVAPVLPATREELLAGTRPLSEASKSTEVALTPADRKQYIAARKAFLESGGQKAPPAVVAQSGLTTPPGGENVVAPSASTAAANLQEVPPTAPATPAAAAGKVANEIERLVDIGDAKGAADVQKRVLNTLQQLVESERTNPTGQLEVKVPDMKPATDVAGKTTAITVNGVEVGVIRKDSRKFSSGLVFTPSKAGAKLGLTNVNSDSADTSYYLSDAEISSIISFIGDKYTDSQRLKDPRKYVIRIPGDGTFTIPRSEKAILDLMQRIKSGGAEAWRGVAGRPKPKAPSDSQLRGPKFSPTLTAADKKQLEDLILTETANLTNPIDGRTPAEIQENIDALRKAIAGSTLAPENQSVREMTSEEHWSVEKDREEAAQRNRTPAVTEAPETAKTKAQTDAEGKVEGAKRYGASGVRFNIGGPKNPDSFGGEIRGEKGVKVATTPENWNEKDLQLIKDYLSSEAGVLRNLGYPKFYFNSHITGEDSNWISAPVPAANGNFLVYEVNPKGSGAVGNSYRRTARLFRKLVNADGKQIGSMTEVGRGELVGMSTVSIAPDGKPLFQVPAIFHAMMKAAQDSLASRQMTEGQVNFSGDITNPNPLNARIPLSGTIHEDMTVFEENELTPPGLRDKMEVFNGLKSGEAINAAIIGFIGSPDNASAAMLSSQLQTNGLWAAGDAESFIQGLAAQMGLEPGTYALVTSPTDDELYPIMKRQGIYPTEARLMLKWIQNGYQRIIYEVGKHDPETGLELPDKVQSKVGGVLRWLPKPGPNGEKLPLMINNPDKWRAPVAQWMTAEDFTVRDKDGKVTFMPKPHQVVGPNMAMTRWFPPGVDSGPRDLKAGQPRAILINDAPGTGKTLQMLMAAVLYRRQLIKLSQDPTSKWFGTKIQPVLIVTQNAQIIQNAFKGDATMAGIELNGQFTETGFEPDEYDVGPDGGRILKGNSWIDIATYSSIKPTSEKVLLFESDGKTAKMQDAILRNEAGNPIPGPDGKEQIAYHPTEVDAKGMPVPLREQAFKMVKIGPPKKGNGKWGVIMFDESHNMKNDTSARSDAGFEIMSNAQHVMLASGTPIDKPTQLGPILGMLLDKPMEEIAAQLGMKLAITTRSADLLLKKRAPEDGAPIMDKAKLEYGTMPADPIEREKAYNNLFIRLRMLRDEAGKAGAILRRSTKYFGVDNIWLDPTDSFHPEGQKALLKLQTWWFNEMALGAEGETGMNPRNMRGMLLFESKRLTSLIKCGIPGTPWNPSDQPKGAAKIMLDELKEGRKVIITMDTSNPFNLADTANIRRFRGLKTTENAPLPYESEWVQWKKYLDSLGIKFGSITGDFGIAEREHTVREFQKNNPDLPVIIMTTMSGGTGLSIDDRHGVGGKTNPKKQYTDAEIATMKQVAAEEIDGQKVESGSLPRTMIIVSSPWGGDVFIQAMGRTDRVLSTTPSRIIVLTSHISEGDEKLADLVRMKTMATNAINETGDELAAAVIMDAAENGAGIKDTEGLKPVKELGGVTAGGKSAESVSEEVKYFKNKAKQTMKKNLAAVDDVVKTNKDKLAQAKKNNSTQRDITRWEDNLESAEAYQKWARGILKGLEDGSVDYKSVISNLKKYSYEEYKKEEGAGDMDPADEDGGSGGQRNELALDLPLGKAMPVREGVPTSVSGLNRKGKPSRNRQIIDRLYGVNHLASGGKVSEEELAAIEQTVVDIVVPFVEENRQGRLSDQKLKSVMRMASDVAHLVHKYEIILKKADVNTKYAGQMSFSGKAILQLLKPRLETRTGPIYHEIGHAIFEMLPEEEKKLVVAELQAARLDWVRELGIEHPLTSIVFPSVDWRDPQGLENYDFKGVQVKKAPVPYSTSKVYTSVIAQRTPGGLLESTKEGVKDRVGPALASKALRIAFNNAVKAGWVKASEMPKFAVEDVAAKGWYGQPGQMDVVESGITPQQKATKALLSMFSASMLQYRNTTRAKMESLTKIVKAKDLTTGVNFDNLEITLHHISSLARGGWGHYSVGEDGSLTLTTRADLAKNSKKHTSTIETEREKSNKHVDGNFAEKIGNAPNMVQIFIPGKDVYEMFVHSFGSINPTGSLAAEVFESPRVATFDFVTMANSVSEVVTGLAEDSMIAHNYKYVNADEWIANNTEILFNDFYDRNEHSDLTGLTASITASIFVNASAGGYGNVVKSIVAALVSGRMTPATATAGLSLSGAQWHAEYLKGQNVMAANAAANAPPQSEIDDDVLALDPTPIIGPARRKLESAIEGLHAMAASIAESALDSPVISDGSSMSEWLKSVRRRKFQTGRPDNVTGFGVGYKLQHVWGTLIGQVEQIAQITRDPFVAELSARLYPAPNSGLNVRITYTEDVYAHTSYWTNGSSAILRDNGLDKKVKEAKNDKIRRLVQGAENMPGFEDALTKYILKVHNPIYNTLERIQFEIDAIEADDKGNKTLTASLKRELQRFGLSPSEWRKINDLMLSEESDARIDAGSFNKGGKYDKVALGREADAFLSEFIEAGGIDKLMMDVGRSMAIPKDSPEYLTRAQRFEPESIATADALLDGWSGPFLDWAKGMGHPIADWGSSWVPRMVDGNIVSSYGNASGDDFTLTAAKAMLEDNKFQRVRLPASFKVPLTDFSVSSLIVNSSTMPHLSKAEVADLLTQFLDPDTKKDTLTYPSWMAARVAQIISGKTPKESFMGYDVSAVNLVDGKEVEDIDPITGAVTPRTEKTTLAQHMSVNLQIYRGKLEEKAISLYGSVRKALTIRSFKDEHEMVSRAIDELSQSHERKVLAGPLTPAAAIAIAKKWKTRIEHRASGVQSSNQGYADLFGGQHGNMKTPDSMRQRQMDTAAADKILDRFYIRDPRVFLPAYNESVVRNLMLKKHLPEGFFERMQKSITSSPENRRFWPELTYLMAKITNSQPAHDSSNLFKSIVTLASATTFMPVTSVLQLTESMPAGLHTPHFISSSNVFARLAGSTTPGLVATGNTLRIAALKSANAVVKVAAELATIHSIYVDPKVMELEIDKFMYRLAERSGVIMSTYVDDIPQSSADPRGTVQRFTDKMINRYHRQGNALATVTDMSRVAVLKGNVLMLESTADEILLREFGHYGKNGAPDEASFAKLLKPLEILLLRNLGIPDSELKAFLNHALITRSITQQDISSIPAYKIEQTLRTLIDSGYKEGNLHAQLYSNALNRLNMLTIQRSVPANMSRLRGLVDRHIGVFAGSSMFFLTNFNSALARNVMLPAARMLTSPYTELKRVRNAGDQDKSAPAGTYLTDVGYPVSPGFSTGKMLPAIGLMGAMTVFINFETRNFRKWARNDPATTFMDDRTTLLKVFAAIDQAGFTGNLSLPINVAQALRYQREAAQVAAGPFFGGIAGVVDAGRTILSDKNSANTPTAERAGAKITYDMIIRPIGQVGLQMLTSSGGIGDILNLAGTQAMAHPQTRESFMRWVADDIFNAGNGGKRVPVSKGDLIKAYEKNLITREQMMEGLRIRAQYDSQHAKEMAMREANEAFKRRKE